MTTEVRKLEILKNYSIKHTIHPPGIAQPIQNSQQEKMDNWNNIIYI